MDANEFYPNPASVNQSDQMPPLAPCYKTHLPHSIEQNTLTSYSNGPETFARLMDSVHTGRLENARIGQDTLKIRVEDAHLVPGGIEARVLIVPQLCYENSHHVDIEYQPKYVQPVYPNQTVYQPLYQGPYQYPYGSQNLYINQAVSPQYVPQFNYRHPYSSHYPAQYCYPYSNLAGSIANTVGQLTSSLLRR